ncbi:MAG: YgiT-type zinc finger protein [Desulfobacterales bacterium]|nr:YgiT-type zinc finger protein [Desulfobacterales bacterium]
MANNKKKNIYNYGECEVCDTPLEEKYIKQDFWIKGELIVIDHILAGVCPKCGEKVVNSDIGHYIGELLKNTEYIASAPKICVPIIMFDEFKKEYSILPMDSI